MDDLRFAHNEAILDQFSHMLARVGQGHFIGLIGVDPNPSLPYFEDAGSQTLLDFKAHHLFHSAKALAVLSPSPSL
jgi:hypothetical protein